MSNIGKQFEKDFKDSVPNYVLVYRLPDSAQSFGGSSQLRFSRKNPFDFLMWDSKKHLLYALELKTVSGKAISFEKEKGQNGEIHFHQTQGLKTWGEYSGVIAGFIIEFRALEKTIFLPINEFLKLVSNINKKSFNFNDLSGMNVNFYIIPQTKKRTRFTYHIEDLLKRMSGETANGG